MSKRRSQIQEKSNRILRALDARVQGNRLEEQLNFEIAANIQKRLAVSEAPRSDRLWDALGALRCFAESFNFIEGQETFALVRKLDPDDEERLEAEEVWGLLASEHESLKALNERIKEVGNLDDLTNDAEVVAAFNDWKAPIPLGVRLYFLARWSSFGNEYSAAARYFGALVEAYPESANYWALATDAALRAGYVESALALIQAARIRDFRISIYRALAIRECLGLSEHRAIARLSSLGLRQAEALSGTDTKAYSGTLRLANLLLAQAAPERPRLRSVLDVPGVATELAARAVELTPFREPPEALVGRVRDDERGLGLWAPMAEADIASKLSDWPMAVRGYLASLERINSLERSRSADTLRSLLQAKLRNLGVETATRFLTSADGVASAVSVSRDFALLGSVPAKDLRMQMAFRATAPPARDEALA